MRRGMPGTLLRIGLLTGLLIAIDQLYRILHPEVNLVRASLVGTTALVACATAWFLGARLVKPWVGACSVLASAVLSVLMIEAGWLVSRSPVSAIVHVVILAVAFLALDRLDARVGRPAGLAAWARPAPGREHG